MSSWDDAFSLREEWVTCREWARRALDEAYKSAAEYAEAECEYQTKKHELTMRLKNEGISATLIQMLVKGHELIVDSLKRRNRAELMHKVDLKAIDVAITQEREAFKDYQNARNGDRF